MGVKKGNSKLIWGVLFAFVTVILCYFFTVVYFYFISPYNIPLKIGFWPFVSEKSIGDMYLDATVQINFKAETENFETIEVSVVGVNVRKDGYVLAPLSEFADWKDGVQIKVFNQGTAYIGDLIYQEKNYNLAVLKLKNMDGNKKKIKIPYVNIGSFNDYSESSRVILTSLSSNKRAFTSSVVTGVIDSIEPPVSVAKELDGVEVLDYSVTNGFVVQTSNLAMYDGGAAFDKKGRLLGFSFGNLLYAGLPYGQYFFQPVYGARNFIKNVIADENYSNELVDALCGFDTYEADFMVDHEQGEFENKTFYFNGAWNVATSQVESFSLSGDKGFYLFSDFNYRTHTIEADSIILSVKVGRAGSKKIDSKCDLFDRLYNADKGTNIELIYTEKDSTTAKTLSFTV